MVPLADFTPLSPQAQLAIISLLVGATLILGIRATLIRKPTLDSELVKLNAAIESLQKSVDSLSDTAREHADHATEIEALKEKVRTLEGARENDLAAQRRYTRETTHEIFEKLDELKSSVSQNFQALERGIGQLEGKLEGQRRA